MKKTKVFLGGTCNDSTWRETLIPKLKIDYFNPVVKDWTPECQQKEIEERQNCDYCLYVITPKMTGIYSIAEVADDSNKRPKKTVFCFLETDGEQTFTKHQLKSLVMTGKLIVENGGKCFNSLDEVANYLNGEDE
jgi:hypothetical protein